MSNDTEGEEYYVQGSEMPLDEGSEVEFKGHRSFSVEDVGNKEYQSRQSISKCFCAMLNSNKGGSIYLGVLDSGRIDGLMLTELQKDHVLTSIADCAHRFRPPVAANRYEVRFVPVLTHPNAKRVLSKTSTYKKASTSNGFDDRFPDRHLLRTTTWCWCDYDALAKLHYGFVSPLYVVEIEVKQCQEMKPFLYHNEENLCYIRRNASNQQLSSADAKAFLKQISNTNCALK